MAVLGPGGGDPGRHYDVGADRNTHARRDGNESRRYLREESMRPLMAPVHPPPLSQPEEVIAGSVSPLPSETAINEDDALALTPLDGT